MNKVQPGQKLNIPANAYNAFIDAAQAHKDGQNNGRNTQRNVNDSPCVIWVKNTTAAAVGRFGILAVDSPIFPPGDGAGQNTDEFKRQVAMTGIAPSDEAADSFVITTEPIGVGKIGRAMAIGVTPVSIYVEASTVDYLYAAPKDADSSKMQMAISGNTRILWREDGVGDKLAIVRLNGGGTEVIQAKITASAVTGDADDKQWKYSWVECYFAIDSTGKLSATALTNGRSGTLNAYNRAEAINPDASGSTNPYHNGIYPNQLDPEDTGTPTFTIQPVHVGTPVELVLRPFTIDGTVEMRYSFQYGSSPTSGSCS